MSTVHDGLKVHNNIDIKNSGISSITTEPAQRKCTECDFTASTKGRLNEHYKGVHGGTQEVNLNRHMEEKHDEPREERMEGHFHNKSNCENDESEEENALESAKYKTQDPFYDIGHILLEPTVEIKMTEENSDDVPDLELSEPSVETIREVSEVDKDDDEENQSSDSELDNYEEEENDEVLKDKEVLEAEIAEKHKAMEQFEDAEELAALKDRYFWGFRKFFLFIFVYIKKFIMILFLGLNEQTN